MFIRNLENMEISDASNNSVSVMSYEEFVQLHGMQLESSGVPAHFWSTLFEKIVGQELDAGQVFTIVALEYEEEERGPYDPIRRLQVNCEEGISAADSRQIYLVDHAWTFRTENARRDLRENEKLRNRMKVALTNCDEEGEELVEAIFNELWKYCGCYWIDNAANIEDRLAVWYMMDEVGSAVTHDEKPNFKIVPFMYIPEQTTYSLMFPIRDVAHEEFVTRKFVENSCPNNSDRLALLLPWMYTSFSDTTDFKQNEPGAEYFESGHIEEPLPDLTLLQEQFKKRTTYKVYSEYELINRKLSSEKFVVVDNEDEADILWYRSHFRDFKSLSRTPEKFVNQFPNEYILTVKDLLAVVCRRSENKSAFHPLTYNLKTELTQFVSCFQTRHAQGRDNYWIIKPFNLARGMDIHITNNINYIMRLPATGPKIAQKYIENPVLFYRPECGGKVKFDFRYVILLKTTKPLQLYVYRNFFLRFANKPFELKKFDDYNMHFTVMNYNADALQLKKMLCHDFQREFEDQYPDIPWNGVEEKVFQMIWRVFECAVAKPPPCGIAESPQSRALYAADIMLEWEAGEEVQPKLLEINFMPDCERACDYYPDFYNKVFELLFLNQVDESLFAAL